MVDTREVEHTAQEAHGVHLRGGHTFRSRVSDEKSEEQEITLSRVNVGALNGGSGAIEEQRVRLAAGADAFFS
jgi:hypothetical protein